MRTINLEADTDKTKKFIRKVFSNDEVICMISCIAAMIKSYQDTRVIQVDRDRIVGDLSVALGKLFISIDEQFRPELIDLLNKAYHIDFDLVQICSSASQNKTH